METDAVSAGCYAADVDEDDFDGVSHLLNVNLYSLRLALFIRQEILGKSSLNIRKSYSKSLSTNKLTLATDNSVSYRVVLILSHSFVAQDANVNPIRIATTIVQCLMVINQEIDFRSIL